MQEALHHVCFKHGAQRMENILNMEAKALVEAIEKQTEWFDIKVLLNISVTNVNSVFLFGKRFHFGDNGILDIVNEFHALSLKYMVLTMLFACFPGLAKLPFDIFGAKDFIKTWDKAMDYIYKIHANSLLDNQDGLTVRTMYRDKIEENLQNDRQNTFTHSRWRQL